MTDRDTDVAAIDCETAVRRLWDYLDAELPAPRADEVRAHLAACAHCPPHFEFAARLQAALAAAGADAPGLDAADIAALRARVVTTLRAAGIGGVT